jgi:opacity protein-like surface antigen
MKKSWAIMVIAVTVGTAAFAESPEFKISAGVGGFVSGDFSTWHVDEDVPGDLNRYNAASLGIGPYVFFDITYLELSAGLMIGEIKNNSSESDLAANPNFPAETISLHGSAYLKYPFKLSTMFSLFPLAGIDYNLYVHSEKDDRRDAKFPVSANTQNADAMEALSALSFKVGVGLDTHFSEHLFLRTALFYGIKLPGKMDNYLQDLRQNVDWTIHHGGDFKIALGYRF